MTDLKDSIYCSFSLVLLIIGQSQVFNPTFADLQMELASRFQNFLFLATPVL